ncbi:MAG: hypothetical protein Q9222_007833 [Ikaeria aurantiellina]
MTPQFYARYIPPPNATVKDQNIEDSSASRPAKKRKKGGDQIERSLGSRYHKHIHDFEINTKDGPNPRDPYPKRASFKGNGMHAESLVDTEGRDRANKQAYPHLRIDDTSIDKLPLKSDRALSPQEINQNSNTPSTNHDGVSFSDNVIRKKKKRKESEAIPTSGDESLINKTGIYNLSDRKGEGNSSAKHVKVLSKYEKSIKATTDATGQKNVEERPDDEEGRLWVTHGLVPLPQPPQVPDAALPSMLSALPKWLNDPVVASFSNTVAFDNLPLCDSVRNAMKAKGLVEALAIQATVLPLLLPGEQQHQGDLCIAASTGSGKTLAYALPMIEALRDKPVVRLRGLVVVPTRELVNQAREVLETSSAGSKLNIGTAFGSKTLREEQELLVTRTKRYDPTAYQEQNQDVDEDEELLNWDIDEFGTLSLHEDSLVGYVDDYRSNIDILICTPGRLIEHLQHTRGFTLEHVQWLVVDEADRLLDENLQQWIEIVMPALEYQKPPDPYETLIKQTLHLLCKRELRKVILSATMTKDMSKLQELKLQRPKLVVLQGQQDTKRNGLDADHRPEHPVPGEHVEVPQTLDEIAVQVKDEENKPLHLIELLREVLRMSTNGSSRQPEKAAQEASISDNEDVSGDDSDSSGSASTFSGSSTTSDSKSASDSALHKSEKSIYPASCSQETHGVLIFAHSTSSAHRLSRLLSLLSPQQASKTATLTKSSASSSKKILLQFRDGKIDVIISTDRASRGLDIPDLAYVINYDMPPSVESYIHRVGRTARAGKAGTAITLVGWREGRWFWNEIGRGQRIFRGDRKIARKSTREDGWKEEELERYADALRQLGEETQIERR